MQKLGIQDLNLKGKKVLMRVDFNVPLSKEGTVSDSSRLKAALPSIQWALERADALILMSHLGRPQAKPSPLFSLAPCARALEGLLNRPIQMATDCVGEALQAQVGLLKKGDILLLENLRFHAAEEDPSLDPNFAKSLSELGDVYVNDAFGAAHRPHSSICPITSFFPGNAAAGLLMQKETAALTPLTEHPTTPFYALIGGSKVSTKIGVLEALSTKTDGIFIGGAMAFTFCKAKGLEIGNSTFEADHLKIANHFLAVCEEKKIPLFLPTDFILADKLSKDAAIQIVSAGEGIPSGWQGVDVGPQTCKEWASHLADAKTIFWNGPLGIFEIPAFAKGTEFIASTLASLKGVTTVVGGGDSLAAIHQAGLSSAFSHLSTGGGASLEFLEHGHLPGIDALSDKI